MSLCENEVNVFISVGALEIMHCCLALKSRRVTPLRQAHRLLQIRKRKRADLSTQLQPQLGPTQDWICTSNFVLQCRSPHLQNSVQCIMPVLVNEARRKGDDSLWRVLSSVEGQMPPSYQLKVCCREPFPSACFVESLCETRAPQSFDRFRLDRLVFSTSTRQSQASEP